MSNSHSHPRRRACPHVARRPHLAKQLLSSTIATVQGKVTLYSLISCWQHFQQIKVSLVQVFTILFNTIIFNHFSLFFIILYHSWHYLVHDFSFFLFQRTHHHFHYFIYFTYFNYMDYFSLFSLFTSLNCFYYFFCKLLLWLIYLQKFTYHGFLYLCIDNINNF